MINLYRTFNTSLNVDWNISLFIILKQWGNRSIILPKDQTIPSLHTILISFERTGIRFSNYEHFYLFMNNSGKKITLTLPVLNSCWLIFSSPIPDIDTMNCFFFLFCFCPSKIICFQIHMLPCFFLFSPFLSPMSSVKSYRVGGR